MDAILDYREQVGQWKLLSMWWRDCYYDFEMYYGGRFIADYMRALDSGYRGCIRKCEGAKTGDDNDVTCCGDCVSTG